MANLEQIIVIENILFVFIHIFILPKTKALLKYKANVNWLCFIARRDVTCDFLKFAWKITATYNMSVLIIKFIYAIGIINISIVNISLSLFKKHYFKSDTDTDSSIYNVFQHLPRVRIVWDIVLEKVGHRVVVEVINAKKAQRVLRHVFIVHVRQIYHLPAARASENRQQNKNGPHIRLHFYPRKRSTFHYTVLPICIRNLLNK